MKTTRSIFILFFILFFSACSTEPENAESTTPVTKSISDSKMGEIPDEVSLSEVKGTEFALTLENKLSDSLNSIYTPTLLFAWQEIKTFYKSPIDISASNSQDFKSINTSATFQNSLNKDEYETTISYSGDEVSAKAYFKKSLPFAAKFHTQKNPIIFHSNEVKSFGLDYADYERMKYLEILYFLDDDHFAVKLLPADTSSEMILVKGIDLRGTFLDLYKNTTVYIEKGIIVKKIKEKYWRHIFENGDYLSIPIIKFNIGTTYPTLEGQHFTSASIPHVIVKAYQQTAFVLNENGAEVESYSAVACDTAVAEKPVRKNMVFDKPYAIFIKKKNSPNPYFAMRVMNAELMEKK